jgi:hypothetical protein
MTFDELLEEAKQRGQKARASKKKSGPTFKDRVQAYMSHPDWTWQDISQALVCEVLGLDRSTLPHDEWSDMCDLIVGTKSAWQAIKREEKNNDDS